MSLVITYDDTEQLGRVRLSYSGYSTAADYVKVERSTDLVNWVTIRGGSQAAILSGSGKIDDYEFTPGVLNSYRVTAVDVADPSFIAAGTFVTANNASLTPGLPGGGSTVGDLMILTANIRNSGTGTVNVPAGWTSLVNFGNALLAYRVRQGGDTAPTVTFTGGAAGADTIAAIAAYRGVTVTGASIGTSLLNIAAQDILTPGVGYNNKDITLRYGWKQSTSGGFSISGYVADIPISSALGSGSSMVLLRALRSATGFTIDPTQVIAAGGATAISRGITVSLPKIAFTDQETGSVTPTVLRFRIKNPTRPALNMYIEPLDMTDVTRPSRAGIFDVQGRTLPVIISDVQGSRRFSLDIDVAGYSNRDAVDQKLASGDPMYLETPAGSQSLPRMYFTAGDVSYKEDAKLMGTFTFTIPMTECAAPAATIAGQTYTYADVTANYATYAAVLAGVSSYQGLLDKISTSDVVVT